jgi:hypothetical protein
MEITLSKETVKKFGLRLRIYYLGKRTTLLLCPDGRFRKLLNGENDEIDLTSVYDTESGIFTDSDLVKETGRKNVDIAGIRLNLPSQQYGIPVESFATETIVLCSDGLFRQIQKFTEKNKEIEKIDFSHFYCPECGIFHRVSTDENNYVTKVHYETKQ